MTQYSYSTFTGDGSTAAFALSFDYMKRAHVSVHVDGTVKVDGTDYDWTADKQITFKAGKIPASGEKILISRDTPESDQIVLWANGSYVVAEDLNESDLQWLYNIQELYDGISKLDGGTSGPAVKKITGTAPVQVDSTNAQEPEISVDETISTGNPNALTSDTRLMSEKAIDGAFSQAIGASSVYPPSGVTAKTGKLRIDDTGAEPKQFYWNGTAWVQIPTKGDKGDQGIQGVPGPPPGLQTPPATAYNVPLKGNGNLGTATASVYQISNGDLQFNFGIPVGQTGAKGDVGDGVNYLGEIDATTAPEPTGSKNGDFYVNTVAGTSSWTGLSTVGVNERLIYNGHTGEWDSYASTDLWQEAGGQLYPRNASADVKIGGTLPSAPNITLNANGSANFYNTSANSTWTLNARSNDSRNGRPTLRLQNIAGTDSEVLGVLSPDGTTTNAKIRGDGSASFAAGKTNIISNGSVGINRVPATGTNANNYSLQISGSTGGSYIHIKKDSQTGDISAEGMIFGLSQTESYVWSRENEPMLFGTNNTERMRLSGDGNLLIGGTLPSAPNISLNADGDASFRGSRVELTGPAWDRSISQNQAMVDNGTLYTKRDSSNSNAPLFRGHFGTNPGDDSDKTVEIRANGSATFAGDVQVGGFDGADSDLGVKAFYTGYLAINSNAADNASIIYLQQNGVDRFQIRGNGDVLVGGTIPSAPNITLNSNGRVDIYRPTETASNTALRISSDVGTAASVKTEILADGSASFASNQARIDSTGKVFTDRRFQVNNVSPDIGPGFTVFEAYNVNSSSDPVISMGNDGSASFVGNITAGNVTFNLEPDNPDNYTTTEEEYEVEVPVLRPDGPATTDLVDGEPERETRTITRTREVTTYTGPTMDVKDTLLKITEALTQLKVAAASAETCEELRNAIDTALADV